ncbi:alpha/beta fold hydrolase [Sedimentitalea todarodis]|uniref:Alpha/beta fold hydrolase n=1 Tax=Sedimentitalea todarodis TaxID=1631240 RepID=A0ABU3VJ31_9RHOB|nr:alpha/beta fold hydrolase [Sedimentitalea todarodis]MDU9006170.1 alpha/beta fold hydrolase [Sedimentitalea todarodis]
MPDSHAEPEHGEYHTICADGVNLRVFTLNEGRSGPPLVICNGLGQAVEMLYPLMHEFPDRPIIAFDAAGVGRSDVPDKVTTIPQHAAMLHGILSELNVGRCDVMGISWGGAVAQQLAYDHPKVVRKLVLAITSTGGIGSWWGTPLALSEIMFPFRYVNKAYGDFIGPFMYGGEAVLQPWLFKEYARNAIRPSYEGYSAQVKALCSWTSIPWLGQLTQPTQIIGGALDTLIPVANQVLLASLVPNARLRIYPAGHLLMYSLRSDVGELVADFLDGRAA